MGLCHIHYFAFNHIIVRELLLLNSCIIYGYTTTFFYSFLKLTDGSLDFYFPVWIVGNVKEGWKSFVCLPTVLLVNLLFLKKTLQISVLINVGMSGRVSQRDKTLCHFVALCLHLGKWQRVCLGPNGSVKCGLGASLSFVI